jgi:cobalt/nickel transport system permease protein
MRDSQSPWIHLHILEELATKDTPIHRLHPVTKVLTVLFFIVTVASFDKYAITALLPMFVFPVVLLVLGDLPLGPLVKRLFYATPLALMVGIFNPIFDHTPILVLGDVTLTGGWISLFSILLRFLLSILAGLLLIALSGIEGIGGALRVLKLPKAFVVQLMFLYRYISVLSEETARTLRAYTLRSVEARGVDYRVWGSLTGRLLLRTLDRAGRIYQAMRCRGFNGELRTIRPRPFGKKDAFFLIGWMAFFIIVRRYNLSELLGAMLTGGNL